MKRILFILIIVATSVSIHGQGISMLIHQKSGAMHTIPIDAIESVSFVSTGNVQHNKWYYMLENPGISDYLRDFEYDADDYSYHKIFEYRGEPYLDPRQDWPYGVELPDTVIYNLVPNSKYTLCIQGQGVSFWTLGQLRMIKLQGVNNVRDLGGWPVEGDKSIQYGRIVRGPELDTTLPVSNDQASLHQATNRDVQMLREVVGIKAELDLRSAQERPSQNNISRLGQDIRYLNHPDCSTAPICGPDAAWTAALQYIISCLKDNCPIYIHCRWGADRTGLLCMLIEGVLGVGESNLAKDFEITSFAGNTRFRTDSRFKDSIAYIKSLPGQTLREKFSNYWLDCGASVQELDMLTTLMIE